MSAKIVSEFAGVPEAQAERYLELCDGNTERAIELALASGEQPTRTTRQDELQQPLLDRQTNNQLPKNFIFLILSRIWNAIKSCLAPFILFLLPIRPNPRIISDWQRAPDGQPFLGVLTNDPNEYMIENVPMEFKIWKAGVSNPIFKILKGRVTPLAFIGKRSQGNLRVLQRAEGPDAVRRVVQEYRRHLAEEVDKAVHARRLREEQDAEFAEALAKDREREEMHRKEAEEKLHAEERIIRAKKEAWARLEEKGEATGKLSRISVKLQDGSRIERSFSCKDKVEHLYTWLVAASLMPSHSSKASILAPLCHGNFYLSTTFPSQRLDDMNSTLDEYDLVPNALLILSIIE